MAESMELMTVDKICNRVYIIRGQQVMLDYDLAEIYGYEVKRLNEQVKRNIARFPEDFMFQLTTEEDGFLKSQIATSSWGGKRKLPYAFTEQGIYMLAAVLRGELAEQQSVFIMRAFREMRHYIKQNQQFVTQAEMHLVSARVSEISVQMSNMADRQKKTEQDDRLIVLDYGLPTEQAYHCGASSKDAGKKLCAINVILETSMIHQVIDKLLLSPDIQI